MNFHLARTLTRVERRTEIAKMGRAWRAWGEVVRAEGEAELQTLERHYHVAQTVARVVARVHERRLSRAWSLWARLAARGAAGRPAAARRMSASLSSLPPGLLAAARNPRDIASLARVSRTHPSGAIGAAQDTSAPAAGGTLSSSSLSGAAVSTEREKQARRSRAVMYKAGASAVRGLFRRAEAQSLSRSWQVWRGTTTADAAREARGILGATRIAELFVEAQENSKARLLHRGWAKWAAWSTADGGRLEQEAEAASWAMAEERERSMKAAAAAKVLAAVTGRWEDRVVRARLGTWVHAAEFTHGRRARGDGGDRWPPGTARHGPESPAGMTTQDAKTPHGDARGATSLGGVAPSSASPASAVSLLRSKLRGEASPGLSVLPSIDSWKSHGDDAVPVPHRLTVSPPVPVALAGGLATPTSPLVPLGFSTANRGEINGPTPGSGQAWSDQFNYSSSPCSPYQPPAGVGDESTSAANGRAHLGTGALLFPGGRMDDDLSSSSSSLDLTASAESVDALRSHAAGGTGSAALFGGAAANAAAGSPEASLAAFVSDSSPLLGESVLVSRGGNGDGGSDTFFGARDVSVGNNGGLALVSGEDAMDSSTAAVGVLPLAVPSAVHAHPGESEGQGMGTSFADESRGGGGGTTRMTPESQLSRRGTLSANSGGKIGANARYRFAKSPPYVAGSAGALSLGRDPPTWDAEEEEGRGDMDGGITEDHRYSSNGRQQDQEEEEEEGLAAGVGLEMSVDSDNPSAAEGLVLQSNVRLEQYKQEASGVRVGVESYAVGGELARAAEDFADIMTSVLWRQAFTRWARVSRDMAFHKKEAEANLKV